VTPAESLTVLHAAGLTDTGKVRSNNQDQFMLSPDAQLWVVADGMGGHKGGEVASDLACQEMARSYADHTVSGLREAVTAANRSVHDAGEADPNLRGMGTTMVALAVVKVTPGDADEVRAELPEIDNGDEILAIANVGDSRAYRLADGELHQVTDDHSLVAEMVRDGNLAPEEAETHPQKNILTRVLGPYDEVTVDVVTLRPKVGDRYLLCSDGLFNEVSVPEIAAVLRRLTDPADAAAELVRMALANGARDNTTVVIADVVNDPDAPSATGNNRPAGAYSDPE
jgi:PPM family protein phosphatase